MKTITAGSGLDCGTGVVRVRVRSRDSANKNTCTHTDLRSACSGVQHIVAWARMLMSHVDCSVVPYRW